MNRSTSLPITGTVLKVIACFSMLIDHIGASCLKEGILTVPGIGLSYSVIKRIYITYRIFRLFGRLAFPIYCFLLTEGFRYTSNLKHYTFRMLLFAFFSELPFDMAFYRTPFYPQHQNVYWTLFLGLLSLSFLQKFSGQNDRLLRIFSVGACMAAAQLLNTDYGAFGVGLIAVLYELRESRKGQCFAGALLTSFEITAPVAFLPVLFYNGSRGRCSKRLKLAFYFFYPIHLTLLAVITNTFLRPAFL